MHIIYVMIILTTKASSPHVTVGPSYQDEAKCWADVERVQKEWHEEDGAASCIMSEIK